MKAAVVEMDRIQKTLEIVRDSVPGEMESDAYIAQRNAVRAIESAKYTYKLEQIKKLAKADEERFAELDWYHNIAEIREACEQGAISKEEAERLVALWGERADSLIGPEMYYSWYEDEYMKVLDTVIQAVEDMKSADADDYNQITELWQVKREPRRVDLRDIRIPIDKKHSGELEAAIDKVQAGVKVRMVDIDDIFDMADYVKGEYKGKIPRTALAGTKVIFDVNAQSFAKSYGYTPMSTIAEITLTERQVYLTALYRGRCDKYKYDWRMSEAARDILNAQDK